MTDSPELERERLINEARQLIAAAGEAPLEGDAAARFSAIEGRLDELRAADQRPTVVDPTRRPVPLAEFGQQQAGALEAGVLPSLVPGPEQARELHAAFAGRQPLRLTVDIPDPGLAFAAVTTATGGQPAAYLPMGPLAPRRLAAVAGIRTEQAEWGGKVTFPKWGAGTAVVTAEGSAKSEYDAVTPGSESMSTIAVYTDMTNQMMSIGAFGGALRQRLAVLVALAEDKLLHDTAAAAVTTAYVPAASEPRADSLMAMAAAILAAGYVADVALVNPLDIAGPTGILHGATGAAGETPDSAMRLNLFGMTIYPTNAAAAGSAVVGAWRDGSTLPTGLGPTYLEDPYTQMKNNITTVMLEEALLLKIPDAAAFAKCTFAV